jgi:hypothetical protein
MAFGESVDNVAASAPKSTVGHLTDAAGALAFGDPDDQPAGTRPGPES